LHGLSLYGRLAGKKKQKKGYINGKPWMILLHMILIIYFIFRINEKI
jgi:hypothetical protein